MKTILQRLGALVLIAQASLALADTGPMPLDEGTLSRTSGQAAGVTFEMMIRAKIDTAQFQLGRSLYLDQIYVNKLGKPVPDASSMAAPYPVNNLSSLAQGAGPDIYNAVEIVDALAADLNVDNQIRPVWSKEIGYQKDGVLMTLANSGEFGVSIGAIRLGAPMRLDANDDGKISDQEKLAYRQHLDSLPSMGGLRIQGINLTGTKIVNFTPGNMSTPEIGFKCLGECLDVSMPGSGSMQFTENTVGMYNEVLLSIGDAQKRTGGISWIDGMASTVEDFLVWDDNVNALVKGSYEDRSVTLQGVKLHASGNPNKGAPILMLVDVVDQDNIKKLRLQTRSGKFDFEIGRIMIGRATNKNSLGALQVLGVELNDSTTYIYAH